MEAEADGDRGKGIEMAEENLQEAEGESGLARSSRQLNQLRPITEMRKTYIYSIQIVAVARPL